jgi:uncharacterized membrane protein HdeD (DUF308 family)
LSNRRAVSGGSFPILILAADRFIAAEGHPKTRRIAMTSEPNSPVPALPQPALPLPTLREVVRHELQHLQKNWFWFLLLGILLAVCGTAAIIVPLATLATTLIAVVVLGIVLMISGVALIVHSFWAGKWSGMLLNLLVGILYLVVGFLITDQPGRAALVLTSYLAAIFILLGSYRIVASLAVRFPQWGWTLLNGVVTLLAGIVIYRHFAASALWVIGLLVGLEMLFNGWTWIMLALTMRKLPVEEG